MNSLSKLRVKVTLGNEVRVEIFHSQETSEIVMIQGCEGDALSTNMRGEERNVKDLDDSVATRICEQKGQGTEDEEQGGRNTSQVEKEGGGQGCGGKRRM